MSILSEVSDQLPKISRKTNIDIERLQGFVKGEIPNTSELISLARYLKVPPSAFMPGYDLSQNVSVKFRSAFRASNLSVAQLRISTALDTIVPEKLPSETLHFAKDEDQTIDLRFVENLAAAIKVDVFEIPRDDPVIDLHKMVAQHNIADIVCLRSLNVDGASGLFRGRNFIILSTSFIYRMMFTLAHELGHIVLGHSNETFMIDEKVLAGGSTENNEEAQANSFASAFLLPALGVSSFLRVLRENHEYGDDRLSSDEVAYLAAYFNVSFEVAGYRLEQLKIVPNGVTSEFKQNILKKFTSLEEYMRPLRGEPQKNFGIFSYELRQSVRDRLNDGDLSLGNLSDVTGFSISEILDEFR